MKLFNVILIVYSLLTGSVFGATITDDTVKIGKPGSSANKEITLGTSKKIRANESTGKLEFSNDGVLYKNLGSGSGTGGSTGTSILENASFEDGLTPGWTSSGGTFTQQTYTNGVDGNTKYARFIATAAGEYFETALFSVPTNFSGGCQADFKKVNVSTNDLFKVEVLDSSANVLSTGNVKASSWVKFPTINFTCPTAGTQIKLRVTSLSAGTIQVDDAYLGSNQNLVYASQAKLLGTISFSGCTGQWSTTSTTFADFSVQTGCTYTSTGNASQPSTMIPAIKFSNIPAGDIAIDFDGAVFQNTAGKVAKYRFTDGTNIAREEALIYAGSSTIYGTSFRQTISYTSPQSNVTIKLQAKNDSGGTAYVYNDSASGNISTIKVWYYPSSSDVAVSPEQASWLIDANIGGANPSIGTAPNYSYTEITNASLDLTINAPKGSANAEIACASGTASTGLTCASSESIGIAFTPPYAGQFEACFDFSHNNYPNAGDNEVAFQLIETSNTSSAILSEGGTRIASRVNNSNATNVQIPFHLCGSFNFADTSKKTIRLAYEMATTGTLIGNTIQADKSSSVGQRDIHVTVRPLLSAFNRPILTGDQVTTQGSINPVIYSGTVSLITGAVTNPVGTLINGNCSIASSVATCNFLANKFLTPPNCTFSTNNSSTAISNYNNAFPTTSGFAVKSINSANGAGVSNDFQFICHGVRP